LKEFVRNPKKKLKTTCLHNQSGNEIVSATGADEEGLVGERKAGLHAS